MFTACWSSNTAWDDRRGSRPPEMVAPEKEAGQSEVVAPECKVGKELTARDDGGGGQPLEMVAEADRPEVVALKGEAGREFAAWAAYQKN